MAETVVIAGALAQKPRRGGHTWVFLQYLLGFRQLGYDVLFIDVLEPGACVNAAGQPCPVDASLNLCYFLEVMERFGLSDRFTLLGEGGQPVAGLARPRLLERVRRSALLLNIMGFLTDEEILAQAPRRVFLDIDPGFGQMWHALGLHDPFAGHDTYVTIGENIGDPCCTIPTCGLPWLTTPQPVVLAQWPDHADGGPYFTSIASWRGAYGPVTYRGKTYGLRVHEFRQFAPMPALSGQPFQLALDIHADETNDLALLREGGWSLVEPQAVAGDPWAYRAYIQGSRGEFMVAKSMYVQTHSGWFSDRSICYLASGKPVLAQDTGIGRHYPTGEGLLTFTTLDDALAGVEAICTDYPRHARAARAIAAEYFAADKVLGRLLARLGVG